MTSTPASGLLFGTRSSTTTTGLHVRVAVRRHRSRAVPNCSTWHAQSRARRNGLLGVRPQPDQANGARNDASGAEGERVGTKATTHRTSGPREEQSGNSDYHARRTPLDQGLGQPSSQYSAYRQDDSKSTLAQLKDPVQPVGVGFGHLNSGQSAPAYGGKAGGHCGNQIHWRDRRAVAHASVAYDIESRRATGLSASDAAAAQGPPPRASCRARRSCGPSDRVLPAARPRRFPGSIDRCSHVVISCTGSATAEA